MFAEPWANSCKDDLQATLTRVPDALSVKILLSHVYLLESTDWETARRLLEEILAIDPDNREARHHMEVLRKQRLLDKGNEEPNTEV
ncbi:MAG: hypothetical protein U0796_00350 [Gemmatales bacterium]